MNEKVSRTIRLSVLELAELSRFGISFKEAVCQGLREVIHRERKKAGEPPFYGPKGEILIESN